MARSLRGKQNNLTTADGFNLDNSQSGNSVTSINSEPDDMDVETKRQDRVESDSEEDANIPSTTEYRYQNILKSHLPFNSLDNSLCLINNITYLCPLKSEPAKLNDAGYGGNLSQRQLHSRVNKVLAMIRITESPLKLLLKYWLGLLFKQKHRC